eukprot:scaffold10485_cov35-Attheya_sp.AAC.1
MTTDKDVNTIEAAELSAAATLDEAVPPTPRTESDLEAAEESAAFEAAEDEVAAEEEKASEVDETAEEEEEKVEAAVEESVEEK